MLPQQSALRQFSHGSNVGLLSNPNKKCIYHGYIREEILNKLEKEQFSLERMYDPEETLTLNRILGVPFYV
jgi:hypothetical protein